MIAKILFIIIIATQKSFTKKYKDLILDHLETVFSKCFKFLIKQKLIGIFNNQKFNLIFR